MGSQIVVENGSIRIERDPFAPIDAAIENAVNTFNREHGALFTSAGQPKWGAEKHGESVEALQAALGSAFDDALAETERIRLNALANANDDEHGDPLSNLSAEDLQLVAARSPLVAGDLRNLAIDALSGRLDAVVRRADRLECTIYHREARSLAGELRNHTSPRADQTTETDQRYAVVNRAVAALAGVVDPERSQRITKARSLAEAAQRKRFDIIRRRQAADGTEAKQRTDGMRRLQATF